MALRDGNYRGSEWSGFEGVGSSGIIRGPSPKLAAWLMSGYWLNGTSFVNETILNDNQTFIYGFTKPSGEAIVFAWNINYTSTRIGPVPNVQETDLFGRSVMIDRLGSEPVLFRSSKQSAQQIISEIKSAIG